MESVAGIGFSVSHTTRKPRDGESDGRDYYFVGADKFAEMVGESAFVEWAEVHGNRYGTSKAELKRLQDAGVDVLLDIDTQGADQLRGSGIDGTFVFILPPDLATLESRLRGRGTDTDDVIATRLENALTELKSYGDYEYIIVNDDLDEALGELVSVIVAARHETGNMDTGAIDAAFGLL